MTSIAPIERLFAERTGIDLGRGLKGRSLERFIAARTEELGLVTIDAYAEILAADPGEVARLINAATVGLTWFFRDPEQLHAVAELLRTARGRTLAAWVPGCSTGEDVYSLAMIAAALGVSISILGTDVNSDFLAQAERGVYSHWSCRNLPTEHGHQLIELPHERYTISPSLRGAVRFQRHNLVDAPPPSPSGSGWDVVLCRNVLIYFLPKVAAATVARMISSLTLDGALVLGANELLHHVAADAQVRSIAGRQVLQRRTAPLPPRPPRPPRKSDPALRIGFVEPELRPKPRRNTPPPPLPDPEPPSSTVDVAPLLREANALHTAGQLADALQAYAHILALDPLCAEARMFLGIAHFKLGDQGAAIPALRAALFLAPDLWPAAFYLALSHDRLGHHNEAAREYRRVVETAAHPLKLSPHALDELDAWKSEVVHLARLRMR
jgi:chemotaxis protein methyltransferase CheR